MIIKVHKFNINPEKVEVYSDWAQTIIKRVLATPGMVEFRSYRPIIGTSQIVATFEFSDMETYTAWLAQPGIQDMYREIWEYTVNLTTELWGPSPVVPEPLRPSEA